MGDDVLRLLVVGERQISDDLAVLVGLEVRNIRVQVHVPDVGVAAENEVHVVLVELLGGFLGRVVDQRDDDVCLTVVLDLLGFLVDLQRGVPDVQPLDIFRVGLGYGQVGGGAHQRNLDAIALDDDVRLDLAGAVLLEDVRTDLLVVGARDDALDQVLVPLVELVVAHGGAVGADGVDEVHGVLVVGDRGDKRGAALVVAGVGDNGVRVLGADVVHDAGDVGGTHLLVVLVVLQATVEVGDVGDVDGDLVSLSSCNERCCGEHDGGRGGCGDQRASAAEIKHGELLKFGGRCPFLVSLFRRSRRATTQTALTFTGEITSRAPTIHLPETWAPAQRRVRGTFGRR